MDIAIGDECRLMLGDAAVRLLDIPDGAVDLTVTSPPYDNLRTYNGYSFDFEAVASELYRVTKPGGVVVWVVGDATINGSETGTSFRQALYFKDVGFNLHDTMVYRKISPGMAGSTLCYIQCFEYMFVLSKGRPATINIIRDRRNVEFGRIGASAGRGARRHVDGTKKVRSRQPPAEYGRRFNVWDYLSNRNETDHPAVFPEQLAADHIASWSKPDDVVLDPFLGSGTSGKMATLAGRKFIGIELSERYLNDIARPRIEQAIVTVTQPAPQGGLFDADKELA